MDSDVLINGDGLQEEPRRCICTKNDYVNYTLRFQYRGLHKTKGAVLLRVEDEGHAQPKCIRVCGKGDDYTRL